MKSIKTALLVALFPVLLLSAERVSSFYDPGTQRWINRDPVGEAGAINLYGFARCNPLNLWDPFGLDPCDDLATDIGRFAIVGETLNNMYFNWKPGQTWRDYGLAAAVNAAGYRSPSFHKFSQYTQGVMNELESTWPINLMQAAQLAIIGWAGYYTPGLHGLLHGTTAEEQWWLTHIAIERFRIRWLLRELEDRYKDCARLDRCHTHIVP